MRKKHIYVNGKSEKPLKIIKKNICDPYLHPDLPFPYRTTIAESIWWPCSFNGTQAWDNFEFFFDLNQILIALRKFSKKISLLFLRFLPKFWCSNISAVTEHTRNKNFLMSYPNIFFLQNLHFGPIRWVPSRFLKILIIYSHNLHFNLVFLSIFGIFGVYSMCMLSIRGNNFIACWAYMEPISLHIEHTRNKLPRMLRQQ